VNAGRLAVVAVLAGLAGCPGQTAPARSQWKVFVATDAPVPALGQQLYVEFIDAQGNDVSSGETRLVDGSRPELWPVSFGVVPSSSDAPLRLRVRLYRLDETGIDGTPEGNNVLDATATLPPARSGVSPVALTLAMACFGVAPDLAGHRTCDPSTGALAPEPTLTPIADTSGLPSPGSWAPAAVVPCSSDPPAEMACIPGGVFLLGAAHYYSTSPDLEPSPEHLVQLSPFALDLDEMTVGGYRALVQSKGLSPPLTSDPDPNASPQECTYGGMDDGAPLTCVSWAQADQACRALGKRLPTEAEWEYAAGNLGLKTPFPWGTDTDICANAVVARGRGSSVNFSEPLECLTAQSQYTVGPVAGGSPRDVTLLGVQNLGGNVGEWVADVFDPYSGPCWASGPLLVNPVCSAGVAGTSGHASRGGSWQLPAFSAYAYQRSQYVVAGDPGVVATGFRCAVDL
jgi:formylglycine-generating enzyme required for sulfatase activity